MNVNSEIGNWLRRLGLGKYADVFAENEIDVDALPHLTEEDLKEIGVALGARRKILAAIALAPGDAVSAPAKTGDAERRHLTVMFVDLVGSTEMTGQVDPEEMREVMANYQSTVATEVKRFEGHVAKYMGDGVLAYFGWPQAHEDDAERSVRSALGISEALKGQVGPDGKAIAARIGIATGHVVVGDLLGEGAAQEEAVVGGTPNLAARLQSEAEPGQIVVSEATRGLLGDLFDVDALAPRQLKGIAKPVTAFAVAAARVVESRFTARASMGILPLLGRDQELALILERWRQAKAGEGQMVLLTGEAGIGKSRIANAAVETIKAEPHLRMTWQCSPYHGDSALFPAIQYLTRAAEIDASDSVEARLSKLEALLAGAFDDVRAVAPLFAALLGIDFEERYGALNLAPQQQRARTLEAMVGHIAGLSQRAPLLVVLEDAHWIDPTTRELVELVLDQIDCCRVFILATTRPDREHGFANHPVVTRLALNRLGREQTDGMIRRLAMGKELPLQVVEEIAAKTDGVPLFVEELTKTVLEEGFLEEQADRFVLKGPLPALAVPATLHDSLMARLDRLEPVKRVIQGAACIGREFGAALLADILAMDAEELDRALGQLLEAQLIFRRGGAEDASFIFKHALVQDAAYGSLLVSVRKALHQRLTQALERRGDPDPLTLARHYSAAGMNEQAANRYSIAGRRSLADGALSEAIGALELGLREVDAIERSSARDRIQLDLRVALGTARMASFGWAHPSVSEALEPAFALARSFDDWNAQGSILWGLWVHFQTRTDFPQAHAWLSELESAAREDGETDLPLIYDMSAGCQYFWEAEYSRALRHTEHVKTIYNPNIHSRITTLTNHDPLVFSQHWAGSLTEWITGYPERSEERLDEAVSLARKIGHPFNLVFALTAGATNLIYLCEADRLLELCDEAAQVAADEALGPFSEYVNIMQWRGGAHIQRGEFAIGHPLVKAGNDFWTNSGGRICTAMFRGWIVQGLQGLGRIEEARRLNGANITHCRTTGDCYMEPECVRLDGELSLQADPMGIGMAENHFREAIRIARSHGARSWELRAAVSLAGLLSAHDRRAEAVACLEPVLNWFTEGQETNDLRGARSLLETLS